LAESQGAQLPKDWNAGLIDATEEMVKRVDARLGVVGDDEGTTWKVGGALSADHLLTPDIDSRAVIVGKVIQRLDEGHWRQILNLAKQSLVNRQTRREQERQPPPEGNEDNFLSGPALVLDVLAISGSSWRSIATARGRDRPRRHWRQRPPPALAPRCAARIVPWLSWRSARRGSCAGWPASPRPPVAAQSPWLRARVRNKNLCTRPLSC
jgi:hypothetical protein